MQSRLPCSPQWIGDEDGQGRSAAGSVCAQFSKALLAALSQHAAARASAAAAAASAAPIAAGAAGGRTAENVPPLPDCTVIAEGVCGASGSCVAPPTLNGWLLGYPVVFSFHPENGCVLNPWP